MPGEPTALLAALLDRAGDPGAPRAIYPPASYSPWWWLVVAGCLAGIVAVLWWARRALRATRPEASPGDGLARLREQALARIDAVAREHDAGTLGAPDAHQRLSAEVRRFAGIATGGHADYRVLPELRRAAAKDPRLAPVADLVAAVEDAAFAGPDAARTADLAGVVERSREVVRQWR